MARNEAVRYLSEEKSYFSNVVIFLINYIDVFLLSM